MGLIFQNNLSDEAVEALFVSDDKCLEFLADLKWADGFTCRKCGNTNSCSGKSPHSRRCTKCKSEESATSGTIFHNCKFPINKAFFIAYTVCVEGKDISSYEYSDKLGLNQMTCWKFRKRIKDCVLKHAADKQNVPLQTILLSEY